MLWVDKQFDEAILLGKKVQKILLCHTVGHCDYTFHTVRIQHFWEEVVIASPGMSSCHLVCSAVLRAEISQGKACSWQYFIHLCYTVFSSVDVREWLSLLLGIVRGCDEMLNIHYHCKELVLRAIVIWCYHLMEASVVMNGWQLKHELICHGCNI